MAGDDATSCVSRYSRYSYNCGIKERVYLWEGAGMNLADATDESTDGAAVAALCGTIIMLACSEADYY